MPIVNTTRYAWSADWNEVAGVYIITDAQHRVIYIGETDNLKRRMAEHRANTAHLMHQYNPMYVLWEGISDQAARFRRESVLIAEYAPLANR